MLQESEMAQLEQNRMVKKASIPAKKSLIMKLQGQLEV
jgi:hypothetical protein